MRVARRWLAEEQPVAAITRSARRAEEFRNAGLFPVLADVTQPQSLAALPELIEPGETILFAVGYDRASGLAMREVYVAGLVNVLNALPGHIGKIIYISSTGVYGQNGGEWIDEDSPTEPRREGGRVCLEAERALLAHPLGTKSVILRLAGIYGPGRVPNRAELESAAPLAVDPHGYLNLIHGDDAAAVVLAAEAKAVPPRTYLVSDGNPVPRGDYYAELARLWQTPPPRFASPHSAEPQTSTTNEPRRGSDKRVNAARLQRELSPVLQYPDYRIGLAAIISGEV